MLKSPAKQEKKPSRSLRKLMKRKLPSFKTKDRTDNEEFGDSNKWFLGRKNKLPPGIPREIVFDAAETEDYGDCFSTQSQQSRGVPDLISAETPIKTKLLPPSESDTVEKQPNVSVQSLPDRFQQALPDRFQSLQRVLFTNRKSLLAVAAAALVYSQVPETTKLQLSVFAAGLSNTIMEQSKTLITTKLPNATGQVKNTESSDSSEKKVLQKSSVRDEPNRVESKKLKKNIHMEQEETVSEEHEDSPPDYIDDVEPDQINSKVSDQIVQQAVPAERNNNVIIRSPIATLQEVDGGVAMDHLHGGAAPEASTSGMVTSQVRASTSENDDENLILVQSNILVQHDNSANTIIVQNNIVVPEGSKGRIIVQSNIEVPEGGGRTVNIDPLHEPSTYQNGHLPIGASMQDCSSNSHSLELDSQREVVNPSDGLESEEGNQIIPMAMQPGADELPPKCKNVFKKLLDKDCRGSPREEESTSNKENWIESLSIDDWILHMDL